eukprot:1136202-Pelagomonas_calceolata.AAC.1
MKLRLISSRPDAILVTPSLLHTTKLALKLHAHSVWYACKPASIRCAIENTSLNSHHRDQGIHSASKFALGTGPRRGPAQPTAGDNLTD